jgi:hypothetical protein
MPNTPKTIVSQLDAEKLTFQFPLLAGCCRSKTKMHHYLTDRLQVQSSHVGVI